ncbi:MAG: D-tyrosyl-tRNA(Tyr) deacylase [Cyclobacteriaceae bacterium]|nr:D-tyrosyl-tRNA(Tyr) deacylase [Cyclobacteriaceae bacterium HetDA_MAG_MS6]
MIAVIQRVQRASVEIGGKLHTSIDRGLLVLLGIESADDQKDVDWLSQKIINLRIFSDDSGKMNESLVDVKGELLVVSQFTLHASTKKGNRPSYIRAATPDVAVPLYQAFLERLSQEIDVVRSGQFGADMQVTLLNDGPVTIIIDTKNKV